MSIKTLRKRIALVAVSALGAGVLGVATAPVATADVNFFNYSSAASDGTSGVCAFGAETDNSTKVGEVISSGSIAFVEGADLADTLNDNVTLTISGPAVWDSYVADTDSGTAAAVTQPSTTVFRATNNDAGGTGAVELPESVKLRVTGVGTIQVTVTKVVTSVSSTVEIYTFTSVTSCLTGAFSAGDSLVKTVFYGTAATGISNNLTETTAGTLSGGLYTDLPSSADYLENGGTGFVAIRIKDGTASANDVTTQGIFSASATNNVAIGFDATQLALGSPAASTAGPATGTAQTATLYVAQGSANKDKPVKSTITLSFNGSVVGVRTLTFTGKPTAITVGTKYIASYDTANNARIVSYKIVDSAGNNLSAGSGVDGAAAPSTSASANNPVVLSSAAQISVVDDIVRATDINAEGTGRAGTINVTCGAQGTTSVRLKYTFTDLSSISTDTDVTCAGSPVNYKASLDKASYAPGEIATLTITATDDAGKAVYDRDASAAGNDLGDATYPVAITMPGMTAVSTPTNTDEFLGGVKTYQFTVGNTEGSYQGIVNLPLYNSTTYAQKAVTVGYKVAAPSTGAVTNAEVLAAIVKLIASINKQIRTLQKQLKR